MDKEELKKDLAILESRLAKILGAIEYINNKIQAIENKERLKD